jgi:hypothetical protein
MRALSHRQFDVAKFDVLAIARKSVLSVNIVNLRGHVEAEVADAGLTLA